MKKSNQVLLALTFVAFSATGFAQTQNDPSKRVLNRVVQGPHNYLPVEVELIEADEENDNDTEATSVIVDQEFRLQQRTKLRRTKAILYEGYSDYMYNQQ